MFELNEYLRSLPQDYKANHAFKEWLHCEADMDMKRAIVKSVEERIERIVGHRDIQLASYRREELERSEGSYQGPPDDA